ncbi:Uncharacterised protein [Serratia quinivorans]|uniref:contact-dependent growth inhibition system immunity protein n=1 Tax=Serratia quinivorans TaxID=137545 RepID=UPI002177B793|nr:contact-dependent growth inhibition system immunity protein [Serratia quinivorans]CAI1694641.1 Uncharacterised protein [Serratia quinivorans]
MITFRKLIGNINVIKDVSEQSPLELWFESVLDVPIEELTVEDLCRAVRQDVCVSHLMPRILAVMTEDPLAGEYYDGELIAALSGIKADELNDQNDTFIKIKDIINQIDSSEINSDIKADILKINQVGI